MEIERKIVLELIQLLSTITNYRFFQLSNEGSWFLPYDRNGGKKAEKISEWGQESYFAQEALEYKPITKKIERVPFNDYYNQYARRLSTDNINFPDIIDDVLKKYFTLEN